jgi:hypothetical protein
MDLDIRVLYIITTASRGCGNIMVKIEFVGGVLPSGSIFTSFMFFNEPVDDDFAGTFMVIPTALQMALKDIDIKKTYW